VSLTSAGAYQDSDDDRGQQHQHADNFLLTSTTRSAFNALEGIEHELQSSDQQSDD